MFLNDTGHSYTVVHNFRYFFRRGQALIFNIHKFFVVKRGAIKHLPN